MSFIRTVNALQIIRPMPNSSTNALLIFCDDGKNYVLKDGGGSDEGGGRKILVAEYLCYLIARLLHLSIPEHCFIVLSKSFLNSIGDEKISKQLQNSPGLCIGSEYLPWAEPFTRQCARFVANKQMLAAIFGFDQFVYNYDRMAINPNLLYDPLKKEAIMIDHSSAIWPWFDWAEDMNAVVVAANKHLLCREHIKNKNIIAPSVNDVIDSIINRFVDSVPGPWFTGDEEFTGAFIKKFLKSRRDNIVSILSGTSECQH